jgi:outer membrane protein
LSGQTYAHEAGDWIVRAGPIFANPNEDSDSIDVAGIVTLPGVDVGDETQLGLTGVYMLSDRWGLELLAATPFTHDIDLSDLPVKAGSTKQLPPTLSLQYYPEIGGPKFNPYFGIGVNATIFFEEDVDDELNLALDGIVGLPAGTVDADLKLDDSWGVAAQIGFDYMLSDNLLINGAIWWIDIDTEAKISTAIADVKFDVEIDPVVYFISIGYKF